MDLKDLAPLAIAFVFVAIVIGIGADVLSNIQAGQVTGAANCGANSTGGSGGAIRYTACGYDFNATQSGLESTDELGSWLPTIALVIAAAVVIGVLSYFRAG